MIKLKNILESILKESNDLKRLDKTQMEFFTDLKFEALQSCEQNKSCIIKYLKSKSKQLTNLCVYIVQSLNSNTTFDIKFDKMINIDYELKKDDMHIDLIFGFTLSNTNNQLLLSIGDKDTINYCIVGSKKETYFRDYTDLLDFINIEIEKQELIN